MTQMCIDHFSLKLMWRLVKRKNDTVVPIMVNGVETVLYYVTAKGFDKVWKDPMKAHKRKYLTCEKNLWFACDNTTGEAFVLTHMTAEEIRNVGK